MRIHAIQTGRVQVKRAQTVGQGRGLRRRLGPLLDSVWSDWLPTYAFAIEHRDGIILVDTGSNAGLMDLPGWHPYFRFAVRFEIDREQEIGNQLAHIGISPRDVKKVVLTHMHVDHDGGLKDLAHSEVLASADEIRRASGLAGRVRGYLPQRWPSGFDPRPLVFAPEAFGPFDCSRRITGDGAVIAVPTPGHTPHHVSVAVVDDETTWLIAGDATYAEASLKAGSIDGVAPNETEAASTLLRLRRLASARPLVPLPTHDPQTPARLMGRIPVFGPQGPRTTPEIA